MKKRFRLGAALPALLLCASLAAPAFAAEAGTPEIAWLSAGGRPVNYNEELGWLTLLDSETYRYSTVDLTTGERVEYDYVSPFSDELAPVMKYDADDNFKWGYIDRTGSVVIPLEYDSAGFFYDGLARIMKYDADGNEKYGYIDKTGAVVLPVEYDNVGMLYEYDSEGNSSPGRCGWAQKGDSYGIFVNPLYAAPAGPSNPEPGNTEPVSAGEPGGKSPAPGSPGSQNTQDPANSGGPGSPAGNGDGFPIVPVTIAAAGGGAVGAVAAALALKKKK